ncbi:MAG TPA: TRAP transporter small permease [Syntrophorhabdaceae bacterium]|nr:TRAP transporter small permease [Syntrophorhabdaceae bacterium]
MNRNLFDRFIDLFYLLAGFILGLLVIFESIDSFARYLFNRPLPWSVEMAEYALFVITFFGTTWLLREGKHVNVEVFIERLSTRVKRHIRIIVLAISCVTLAFLSCFSLISTIDTYKMGATVAKMLTIPKFIFIAIMFFGYSVLFLESLREFIRELKRYHKGE